MNQEQEIKRAVDKFRKKVTDIRESDNPYYKDKEVQEYEIKQHRAELDATVSELSNAFDAQIAQEIEQAEDRAKASRFYTTETQKQQAEHALDSFVADVTLAYDDTDKHEAYKTLERRLDGMEPAELAHVRLKLPQVLSRVNGDDIATKKLKSLNTVLAKLQTPEEERLEELKTAKRVGVAQAYRRLRFTHATYSHLPENMHSGAFKGVNR